MYKVLKDFTGSPDGCRVIDYTVGQELEVNTNFSADLAQAALAEGWVTEAKKAPAKKAAANMRKK